MRERVDLNKLETVFYFIAWSGGIFYGLYQLFLAGVYFEDYDDAFNDFGPGWSWVGRKRDISDIEWSLWIPFMYQLIPWVTLHLTFSQYLKWSECSSTIICCWYIAISVAFLCYYAGGVAMIFLLTQPCIACLLTSFRSKRIAYVIHFATLGVIQLSPTLEIVIQDWLMLQEDVYQMIVIAVCWMQLRTISCSIDNITDYKHRNIVGFLKNFIQSTAYCLYLPTLFLGPFVLYSDFIRGIEGPFKPWTFRRISIFILNITRFTFWIFFTDLSMHFIYCNALQYHPDFVAQLNPWAFYAMGYAMGQYFLNKYVVFYGTYGEISRADDINAPPPPKCIGRIHLYSEMWKHFDRGLYQFLIRYIYVPIASMEIPLKKILASFISFGFVFLWHGVQLFIFTWSFLNFLGLTIEGIARSVGNTPGFIDWEEKWLTSKNIRRFHCMLASPLLALSAISNFYFFAGQDIGNIFIYRIFHDSPKAVGILLFLLYCCCQVSTEMKNRETGRETKTDHDDIEKRM
ncbi:protein-cysteine N-palmitoyltransferase Rasp [Diachasmimorpha longicaudata]|uniref:protein-cysteine N-palmitoyltransferase Rasp n=1 Tax=Diachasmimorpha longicaudata TaxID=58733 RepID=UPI0030B90FA6